MMPHIACQEHNAMVNRRSCVAAITPTIAAHQDRNALEFLKAQPEQGDSHPTPQLSVCVDACWPGTTLLGELLP